MAFIPANVADANRRVYSLPDTDVSTNETGVALPVEITYADFPEFFDETAGTPPEYLKISAEQDGSQLPIEVGPNEWEPLVEPYIHYTMDNIAGSTVTDEMGNQDGTLSGYTQTASGWDGDYLEGGSSASRYVDFGTSQTFKGISLRFRRNVTGTSEYVLTNSGYSRQVYFRSTDKLAIYNGSSYTETFTIAETSNWHHLFIQEGSSNNSHWVWVDGVRHTSEITSNFGGVLGFIGISGYSGDEVDVDDFKLFTDTVTDGQIERLAAATSQDTYPGGRSVIYIPVDADTATGAEVTISADGAQDDNVEYVGLTGDVGSTIVGPVVRVDDTPSLCRRLVIDTSSSSAKSFKIEFMNAGTAGTLNCWVYEQANTGDAWDGESGTGVQVSLGGNTAFEVSSTSYISDAIDFDLAGVDNIVIAVYSSGRAGRTSSAVPSGCSSYYKDTSDESGTPNVSSYTSTTAWLFVESVVEVSPNQSVYDSNFAAVYHMAQDPSGGAGCILDSTDNERHGTPTGVVTADRLVDDTVLGKCLYFDSSGDYITTSGTTVLSGADGITIEVVAKGNNAENYDGLLGSRGSRLWALFLTSSNTTLGFYNGASTITGTVGATTKHHMAGAWDNSGDTSLIIDGLEASNNPSGATSISIDAAWIIGKDPFSDGRSYKGWISEVRLSNTRRSTTWNLLTAKAFLGTLWTVSAYGGGGSAVARLQYWDALYGDLTVPNTQYWDSIYSILFPRTQYFDELYGMLLTAYWNMPYGNNPIVKKYWDERYGDNPLIKKFWDMPYGDRTELLKYWDETYNLNKGLIQYFDEVYGINSKEILQWFDEGYDIKDTNPVLAFFNEYYTIMSDSVVESSAVHFYIDGVEYDPFHVSFELNKDSFKNTGEMHFANPAPYLAASEGSVMRIVDTDIDLYLEATIPTKRETTHETTYIIQAESKSRILEKAKVFTEEFTNTTAQTIVSTIASRQGITVDWQILNWPIKSWNVNDKTPYKAIHEITSASGAIIQSDFDGNIYICKPMEVNSNEWDTGTPTYLLVDNLHFFSTNQRGEQKPGYNKYRASDQSDASETRTTLEDDEYGVARRIVKAFRVPWDGVSLTLKTSDNNASILYLNIVEEELEEAISVVNGEGESKTQKPFYAYVSHSYNDTNLGKPTVTEEGLVQTPTSGQSLLTLKYKTKYYKWLVTDYDDPEIQVWVE